MSLFANLRSDRLITQIKSSNDLLGPEAQKAVAKLKAAKVVCAHSRKSTGTAPATTGCRRGLPSRCCKAAMPTSWLRCARHQRHRKSGIAPTGAMGKTWYDALQLSVNKRFSRGLTFNCLLCHGGSVFGKYHTTGSAQLDLTDIANTTSMKMTVTVQGIAGEPKLVNPAPGTMSAAVTLAFTCRGNALQIGVGGPVSQHYTRTH